MASDRTSIPDQALGGQGGWGGSVGGEGREGADSNTNKPVAMPSSDHPAVWRGRQDSTLQMPTSEHGSMRSSTHSPPRS